MLSNKVKTGISNLIYMEMALIHGSNSVPHPKSKLIGSCNLVAQSSVTLALTSSSESILNLVESFAYEHSLTITKIMPYSISLCGTLGKMEQAFKTKILSYQFNNKSGYHAHSTDLSVPTDLAKHVEAILGLDNRPRARASRKLIGKSPSPASLAQLYNFPINKAAGQNIALIELAGGYRISDINSYFKSLGMETPKVISISVDGSVNNPPPASSSESETGLDIQIIGSLAREAKIIVYFAQNTDKGFYDAISAAANNKTYPSSIISIPWGAAESSWNSSALNSYNSLFQQISNTGVTVLASSGDEESIYFPSTSPFVLSCGGINEGLESSTGTKGTSEIFPVPSYQNGLKGRSVPDVSSPATGYNVYVDGSTYIVGSNSIAVPLWTGLLALCNENIGRNIGFINPILYSKDFTLCFKEGWDPRSGLGITNGINLLNILKSKLPAPIIQPTPKPQVDASKISAAVLEALSKKFNEMMQDAVSSAVNSQLEK